MNKITNNYGFPRLNIKFCKVHTPLLPKAAWEIECLLIKIFEYGDYSFRSALLGSYSQTLACIFSLAKDKENLVGAAGCLYARKNPTVAIVGPLGIEPKYRRKGIGSELVGLLLNHLASKSCLAAYLSTPTGNTAAKFYKTLGFKKYKGITMRYLFHSPGAFEESYFGKHTKTKIRRAVWGDFPGIQALSVFPCRIYTFDFRQSIFSSKYVPPVRFLSIFPEMMKTFERNKGFSNVLVSGHKENIVGIAHISRLNNRAQQHVGIFDFYVHDNFIGQAKYLLKKTIEESRSLSINKINCYCLACDSQKQDILSSFGANQIAVLPGNIFINHRYCDVLIYQLGDNNGVTY